MNARIKLAGFGTSNKFKNHWSILFLQEALFREVQIFQYTRFITLKRVTSLRGSSPRHCAHATYRSSFPRNVAAVASRATKLQITTVNKKRYYYCMSESFV